MAGLFGSASPLLEFTAPVGNVQPGPKPFQQTPVTRLFRGNLLSDFTAPVSTTTTTTTTSHNMNDPFMGAAEPLDQAVPDVDPWYAHPWTSGEDGAFFSHIVANTSPAFVQGETSEPSPLSWTDLRASYTAAFPQFPARELSDLITRWTHLQTQRILSPADKRAIYVLRNSTVAEEWADILQFFLSRGKLVEIQDIVEAEREFGYRLNIADMGFVWPQPEPEGTAYAAEAAGSVELRQEFEQTMAELLMREQDLVETMHYVMGRSAGRIARHYRESGVSDWDEEDIDEMIQRVEERSDAERAGRFPRLMMGRIQLNAA